MKFQILSPLIDPKMVQCKDKVLTITLTSPHNFLDYSERKNCYFIFYSLEHRFFFSSLAEIKIFTSILFLSLFYFHLNIILGIR